jgi:hypothetical protein
VARDCAVAACNIPVVSAVAVVFCAPVDHVVYDVLTAIHVPGVPDSLLRIESLLLLPSLLLLVIPTFLAFLLFLATLLLLASLLCWLPSVTGTVA